MRQKISAAVLLVVPERVFLRAQALGRERGAAVGVDVQVALVIRGRPPQRRRRKARWRTSRSIHDTACCWNRARPSKPSRRVPRRLPAWWLSCRSSRQPSGRGNTSLPLRSGIRSTADWRIIRPMQNSDATSRVAFAALRDFIAAAFERVGLPAGDAAQSAKLMAEAELQGSDGHGVIRLVPYAQRIRAGGINLKPDIRVVEERAAMALVDGDNGMGHLVMKRAARDRDREGAHRGRRLGRRAHGATTPGPASLYARMPLAHDMIGLYFAVGNANHLPPWGGLDMLLSTNPIAVAMPARRRAADRARHGDHRRRLRQGEGQGAARRDDARGLDDRPRGPAAHRSEARRRRLPAADRRLQGLRPGADLRPARRHAERRGDGQRRRSTSTTTTPRTTNTGQAIARDRPRGLRRRRRSSRRASTRSCATCARASACPASSASGCRASRATRSASPTRATASRSPPALRASLDTLAARARHRATGSNRQGDDTMIPRRPHRRRRCARACCRSPAHGAGGYPEQADPHDRAARRRRAPSTTPRASSRRRCRRTWASRS